MHSNARMMAARVLVTALALWAAAAPGARADNFWQSLNGPVGGSIYATARDPATGALYGATAYQHGYNKSAGSVFKSIDHGDSWTFVSADFLSLTNPINTRVRGLAIDSAGVLYAALEGAGVWRSSNSGANWSPINAGLGDLNVRGIAVSPADEVFAATQSAGVYQLSGATWIDSNDALSGIAARCFAFAPGYMLLGTSGSGVFKRPTGGVWTPANKGLTNLVVNSLYVSPGGARLLACTGAGLFESTDQAASWHALAGPFNSNSVWAALESGSGLVVGTAIGIFTADLAGTTWTASTIGFTGTSCRTLLDDGAGRVFAGSFEDGLFRSTDGAQSWSPVNDGLFGRTVTRLVVSDAGTILAGTNQHGIFRSDVVGAPWTGPALAARSIFALAQSPWGDLFAGNYTLLPGGAPDGHAWRSSDEGANWTPLDNAPIVAMVSGFAFPGPQQVLCSTAWGANSIRSSGTNGDQWSLLSPGPGNEAYCIARNDQGDLFIGSEGHGVVRFNAAAQSWTNLGLVGLSQQFSIVINSQGHVFVGNDGNVKGVYKSTANGDGLAPLGAFPGNYGYVILCLPNDDLYVGTLDQGVQFSPDGGSIWTTLNSGIPVNCCQALALGPDGYLYAGVAGFGVYRSAQPVVSHVAGDLDDDGDVDATDVALFVDALLGADATPVRLFRSDLNADGVANALDVAPMTTAFLD